MEKVKISFPDGTKKDVDLSSPEGLDILRHSASHVMAQAVCELFPGTKLAIGPSIEAGFYYDFDTQKKFTPEDLITVENKMAEIIKKDLPFERIEIGREDAIDLMEANGEKYKVEILKEIPGERVTLYKQGSFMDLCRGPHLPSTSYIKAFKLLSLAGAYWRGDEKREMLQRIYGTAFPTKDSLEKYLHMLEEAEKRDHRKLGKELDLFSIHDEAGAGFIYYHPKGAMLRMVIEDFLKKEHLKRGYELVSIPHLAKADLWKRSGHMDYYRENMYVMKVDDVEYVVKPMNCPGHILIFERKTVSYKDLPVRYFELGTVYRYEKSGVLHGLLRVRGFTQDDAHIFCAPEQLQDEIKGVIDFAFDMLKTFGFEYEVNLSTRPEKFVGTEENWARATKALEDALKSKGVKYEIDPGAGVFYGPKIDVKLKDAIGRLWQGPTIQVDFNNPERFDLSYIGEDGAKHRPAMIHRVVLGSLERFLGALIEHYAGAFPVWLAPVQVSVLPIADRHLDYANALKAKLEEAGVRVEVDGRREKINLKIRNAQVAKVPYMLIVGDKEQNDGTVSVRSRAGGDLGPKKTEDFVAGLLSDISAKR